MNREFLRPLVIPQADPALVAYLVSQGFPSSRYDAPQYAWEVWDIHEDRYTYRHTVSSAWPRPLRLSPR